MVLASGGGKGKDVTGRDFYLQVAARDADAKRVRKKYSELVHGHQAWLPDADGYSQIFKSYVFGVGGLWTMALLRCKI